MSLTAALAVECQFLLFCSIVLGTASVHLRSHRHRMKSFPAEVHGYQRMRSDKQHNDEEKYGRDFFHFERTIALNRKCIYII